MFKQKVAIMEPLFDTCFLSKVENIVANSLSESVSDNSINTGNKIYLVTKTENKKVFVGFISTRTSYDFLDAPTRRI